MAASGMKRTFVPFRFEVSKGPSSEIKFPASKVAVFNKLSLLEETSNIEESAFTAFVPTPLSPTDFLNALLSYLPPVFILETTSTTFPSGIPLP